MVSTVMFKSSVTKVSSSDRLGIIMGKKRRHFMIHTMSVYVSDRHVCVSDVTCGTGCVFVFTVAGESVTFLGKYGSKDGQFKGALALQKQPLQKPA